MKNPIGTTSDIGLTISAQKQHIADAITAARKEQGLSVRALAEKAKMKHPQVHRVTGCENYTRDTLFDLLDALNLTVELVPKKQV